MTGVHSWWLYLGCVVLFSVLFSAREPRRSTLLHWGTVLLAVLGAVFVLTDAWQLIYDSEGHTTLRIVRDVLHALVVIVVFEWALDRIGTWWRARTAAKEKEEAE